MIRKQTKKALRQELILRTLDRNPAIRVGLLAQELDVSSETVRRDLAELEVKGQISRTYGGAIRGQQAEPAFAARMCFKVEERQAICHKAMMLVKDAESLFIGGGATTLHFARLFAPTVKRRLFVVTPSLPATLELGKNPLIKVMVLPGIYDNLEGLAQGSETLAAVSGYRTGFALVGATGINEEGVSEALIDSARVTSAIIQNAAQTLVLADDSKFNKRAITLTTGWSHNVALVSNRTPDSTICNAMAEAGSVLHV